ncbi:thioredoxin family protein [Vineibacter terrae]|uniref:DUF899 domain-containing protein n=1 Tax=Vineibacter terrae TaxID=2586908 RepID=UPI002E2F3D93|nr:thioredoxin family protein [Vineibacter terrae]HEX2884988.1 thioredoxin family protein [Vineibacter terrae]
MQHQIVSRDEWLAARTRFLAKEKEFTRLRDQLSAERRALPWVKVEKAYVFDTPEGKRSLAELFAGRSQLIVYHFMFGPGWREGCKGCSFLVDHLDGARPHLENHDVMVAVVSRAPLAELLPFKARMGWRFPWVSSHGSDFNSDYHVSFTAADLAQGATVYNYQVRDAQAEGEAPGISVFYKDDAGDIFHTYSAYARGGEPLIGTYNYLDLVPKGRNEGGLEFPMAWVRHHDRYGD